MAFRLPSNPDAFSIPKKRPEKRKDYLSWIRTLPCCVSGVTGVEAAHTSFSDPWYGHYGRSKGTKAADIFALPLSQEEHRLSHMVNEESWWRWKGVNPHELGLTLWAIYSMYDEYEAAQRATARILQGLPNNR